MKKANDRKTQNLDQPVVDIRPFSIKSLSEPQRRSIATPE